MSDPRPDPPPEPTGPFGWPGIGRYLRGPEGLSPLSKRPRDVALRRLGMAAAVAVTIAMLAILLLGRPVSA